MFCPHCNAQSPNDSNFCSACGARIAPIRARIFRPLHPRMIAGVCSGIALHFGWDVAIVRIALAVITCLTTGCGLLFYIAAWVIIPSAPYANPYTPQQDISQSTTA